MEANTPQVILSFALSSAAFMAKTLNVPSIKGKYVKQSRYRPGVAQRVQEVKVPRLHDNGTGWW
jgi:hypothetical protein